MEENEKSVLLYVDVNIGNGRRPRIIFNEGDKPEVLADVFANEHSNYIYL